MSVQDEYQSALSDCKELEGRIEKQLDRLEYTYKLLFGLESQPGWRRLAVKPRTGELMAKIDLPDAEELSKLIAKWRKRHADILGYYAQMDARQRIGFKKPTS